jgi:hypothetical protein
VIASISQMNDIDVWYSAVGVWSSWGILLTNMTRFRLAGSTSAWGLREHYFRGSIMKSPVE